MPDIDSFKKKMQDIDKDVRLYFYIIHYNFIFFMSYMTIFYVYGCYFRLNKRLFFVIFLFY